MSFADRVVRWNRWYDGVPEMWRFQVVVWSLLAVGAINMLLTLAIGFPFALLVVFGIIALTAIRLPYVLGWVAASEVVPADRLFTIPRADQLVEINLWYEALPDARRIWVYPGVLLIAGAINMMMTISYGFPFGILFLLALLALIAVRAPYTAGWLHPADPAIVMEHSETFDPIPEHTVAPSAAGDAEPPFVDEPGHPAAHGTGVSPEE
jgi:hypothetical protein